MFDKKVCTTNINNKLKVIDLLQAFEGSDDRALFSSFCNDSNLYVSAFK